MMEASARTGPALALLAFLLFSLSDALNKSLIGVHGLATTLAIIQLGVVVCTLLWLAGTQQLGLLRPQRWWAMLLLAGMNALGTIAFFSAINDIPLAELFVLVLLIPPLTALLSRVFLGEKLNPLQLLAGLLALAGVAIAMQLWRGFDFAQLANYPAPALLGVGLHVVTVATLPIVLRRFGAGEHPVGLGFYGSLCMVVALALFFQPVLPATLTYFDGGKILLAIALFLVAQLALFRGYQLGPVNLCGLTRYSQMVWSTLLGWWFFAEQPGLFTLVGAGMMILSGLLLFMPAKTAKLAR